MKQYPISHVSEEGELLGSFLNEALLKSTSIKYQSTDKEGDSVASSGEQDQEGKVTQNSQRTPKQATIANMSCKLSKRDFLRPTSTGKRSYEKNTTIVSLSGVGLISGKLEHNWRQSICKRQPQCRKRQQCKKKSKCGRKVKCSKKAKNKTELLSYGDCICHFSKTKHTRRTKLSRREFMKNSMIASAGFVISTRLIERIESCNRWTKQDNYANQLLPIYSEIVYIPGKGESRNGCITSKFICSSLEELRFVVLGPMAKDNTESKPYLMFDSW